jgi:hypothetical protein
MQKADKASEQAKAETPTWAERLAQRRTAQDAAEKSAARQKDWTPRAITTLWTLFDEAVEQANAALESSGAAERILIHRSMREYRLSMAGPEGEERQLAVFASLTQVGGQPSGGALITTNKTRATIWLVATWTGRRIHWSIAAPGNAFTGRVVADLFLSVFSDDPQASKRLSSYFTLPM